MTSCEPDELERIFKDVSKISPLQDIVPTTNVLQLRKGGDGARGDDASSLKKEVMIWLGDLYGPIQPPISPSLKYDRGLDHDITGRLLCPVEYDWDDAE